MKRDFEKLRQHLDGSDPFVNAGHQIIKSAGKSRHDTRVSNLPEWATDDKQVQELLLRSFPKLKEDPIQRQRAAKWTHIIQLYYRVGWTQTKIAEELEMSLVLLKYYLKAIRRAAAGKTVNNSLRGQNPRGRPKKMASLLDTNGLPIETTVGNPATL